ncbi:MAG: hypothetical protein MRY72_04735 [Aquisalinus sp.]|nr:hypothetical protein [Aquisalinus sp.]
MNDKTRDTEKIYCETPTGGAGVNIPRWKYAAIRDVILDATKAAGVEGVLFSDLPTLLQEKLPPATLEKLGSIKWHLTAVKLDMEVKGELKRLERKGPQRLMAVL